MLNRKVPLYTTLIFFFSTCILGVLFYLQLESNKKLSEKEA